MSATFALTREAPGRLRASGRIDVDNAAVALRDGTRAIEGAPASIDIGALESADSVTLAVLLAWAARASLTGHDVGFVGMPPRLRALARLSAVEGMLQAVAPEGDGEPHGPSPASR
jgi:ABC-type transporter Mla MlaB component